PWVLLGALALAVLLPLYVLKLIRHPADVRKDFTNPALLGFCGALPVGMFLVAGGIAPYSLQIGNVLWWGGFVLLTAFQVWALSRWLSGSIELAQVNAGWLIVLVGGIVAPGPGIALGHEEASRFIFGVSAAAAPLLMALLFYRAVLGAPLPEPLRPSWFILLVPPVPPALVYANGMLLFPGSVFLENLFFASLILAVSLLLVSRNFLRWQFGAPWWAFTFPLDALAYAAARYAQDHPSTLWRGVCAATLALATAFVLLVLFRTLRSVASRRA
ncbi:MAG: putative C4-dicarboxylate transporter/malic acid transport protein, partial [Burkholderiales bacterium]|nr:putative C4-dicarboxylate transporter/malic acid transport protein [Burkholderiales bacterium]